ncbi:ATP-binding cassette domain-containing protein [Pseudonocardia sp. NPDC049154]|uniref:branched-chain amino acid ABC transporter ATP-binding protein/permease n=1 Tax=Pseudonocardia sp. NPDC049154 TaxID=3155501 RepID=UPI00340834E9
MSSTVNRTTDRADTPSTSQARKPRGRRRRAPRSLLHILGPVIVIVAVGAVTSGNDYLLHLATAAGISYLLTASFNLIYGYGGIFNLSLVMTYGLGAFTSVYLETHLGMSFWIAILVAMLVTAALSVLIALPSSRLSELFLAIQTLAFGLALAELLHNWDDFSGGTTGVYMIPSPTIFGIPLVGGLPGYFWLVAVVVLVVALLMYRLHTSDVGRRLVALREGPRVLAAVGVSPASTRLMAFAASGALAGLAGALFAHFQMVVDLETFNFARLTALLLATILGGAGYLYGPVFGVIALMVMDELSLATSSAQDLVYGVGVIVLVLLTSGGIAGAVQRGVDRLRGRRRVAEPEIGAPPGADPEGRRDGPVGAEVDGVTGATGAAVAELGAERPDRSLEAAQVRVEFGGTVAVADASITVRTGEVVGLIGPNGAGKTTLLNAVTGDVAITSGSVLLDGESIVGLAKPQVVQRGIGRTFQSPKVIKELTLLENLMLAGDGDRGVGTLRQLVASPKARRVERETRDRAMALLEDFSLAARAHHRAADHPYGVLRLVEVARNLMLDPSFILLDEPGAGLTEFERAEIAATIRTLSSRRIGVVLVDHNLPLINAACDRIYVLDAGRVIADGPPAEVFAQAGVRSAYLGVPE